MPVTISGDATKRIEALVYNLSDDKMRDLTVQLRDSLVGKLAGVQWSGKTSVLIGRGLAAYTEPVRTPTGGWMCGVGSLDILHRGDAPPKTITDFLEWYRRQYRPAEKKARKEVRKAKAEKALRAEAQIKIAALQTKRIEKAWERKVHIHNVSLPYWRKLIRNVGKEIGELEYVIADRATAGMTKSVDRLRNKLQKLETKRSGYRSKIRELGIESSEIERNLGRWGQ